jgi:hypothetical protein
MPAVKVSLWDFVLADNMFVTLRIVTFAVKQNSLDSVARITLTHAPAGR